MTKRIFSLLLAIVMVVTMLPMTAMAAGGDYVEYKPISGTPQDGKEYLIVGGSFYNYGPYTGYALKNTSTQAQRVSINKGKLFVLDADDEALTWTYHSDGTITAGSKKLGVENSAWYPSVVLDSNPEYSKWTYNSSSLSITVGEYSTRYYLSLTGGAYLVSNSQTVTFFEKVGTHTHDLERVPGKDPTCTEYGRYEYWTCSGCGMIFKDENGTKELEYIILKDKIPHKDETDKDGYCDVCNACMHVKGSNEYCSTDANCPHENCSVCGGALVTYSVTIAESIPNGTVAVDKTSAAKGDTVKVTATPENGYEIESISVVAEDGTTIAPAEDGSFTMPASDVTVSASFKQVIYTVTVDSGIQNGTVTATPSTDVAAGTEVTVTATPDAGYHLNNLTVEPETAGFDAPTVTDGKFTMPASNVTVKAIFAACTDISGDGNHNCDICTARVSSETCYGGIATCSAPAVCEECGELYGVVAPDAHVWDNGKITTDPTCKDKGVKTFTCTLDSTHTKTEDVAVDPNAHVWDDGEITTDPTCKDKGVKTFTCTLDSTHTKTEDVAVDPDAHDWSDTWTHVENGTTDERVCENDNTHKESRKCICYFDIYVKNPYTGRFDKVVNDVQYDADFPCIHAPFKAGYEFIGWKGGRLPEKMPAHDVYLIPCYRQIYFQIDKPAKPVTPVVPVHDCPSAEYRDLDTSAWYHDATDYVLANDLMKGTGNKLFSPYMTTTRAMVVTILYRLEGEPAAPKANPFSDVPADEWYTDAVLWAAKEGIVLGYDGEFFPEDEITGEQLMLILQRYAEYRGADEITVPMIAPYEYNTWAEAGVVWAYLNDILEIGIDVEDLTQDATRVELAAYLYNFCVNFIEK
ncbi:MAG: hypothetical protein E7458_09075 [Ruminococcaceae bacterium]|nr:hypothetical protein [Oscillospiraceae bacterium]